MAKDRLTPCKFYISFSECTKGRFANHNGYCQRCNKYVPRVKEKHINRKKKELEKIKRNEVY